MNNNSTPQGTVQEAQTPILGTPPKSYYKSIPYHLAGRRYPSKQAVTTAVQEELAVYQKGELFTSPLLTDLISKHHHRCAPLKLQPTHFRKMTLPEYPNHPTAYELQGYFPSLQQWHDVSWKKCLNPPTYLDEVYQSLRFRIAPQMKKVRSEACHKCGSRDQLDVHHATPTFATIAQEASKQFTPAEILNWAYHDWVNQARFSLPENHPVVKEFDRLHKSAALITLCRKCHVEQTQIRSIKEN